VTRGVAIYIEGGGDGANAKASLRQGFDGLLGKEKSAARDRRLHWKLVMCGTRGFAYDAFINAVANGEGVAALLVDSEGPLAASDAEARVRHLRDRDGWDLSQATSEYVHLMTQCMEAWIVADGDAVAGYYGKGFVKTALPTRQDLEAEPKAHIYAALARATAKTQKGEYHEIRHASQLLPRLDRDKVGVRCPCFSVFTEWLLRTIEAA
jgi:hypothetical protein